MSRSRVLVLSFSNLDTDPRVGRHIAALAAQGFRVVTCGMRPPATPVEKHIEVSSARRGPLARAYALAQLLARRHEAYYWGNPMVDGTARRLEAERFDAVLANDLSSLPLALRAARGAPVLFDAHEYSPDEFGDRPLWRLVYSGHAEYLCRTYLPRVRSAITVCEGLAQAYERAFAVPFGVITNAANPIDAVPAPVSGERIRMVHHGAAIRSRHIEDMIDVMAGLDERFSLDLILVPGSPGYEKELKRRARGDRRISFPAPVPPDRIVATCARYDVGLCLFRPVNRSLEYCLPNKFFEFLQARVALAIGPSPEMARIVREFDCGVVAEDHAPRSLARRLAALTPEALARMKSGADRAARAHNAQANAARLCDRVERMLRVAA